MIDRSAVLWTGKRSIVYVKTSGDWTFQLREIELGNLLNDQYEVLSGLRAREELVTNGVFVVDAEAQLQGISSMITATKNASNQASFTEISLSNYKDYKSETNSVFQDQLLSLALEYIHLKDAMVASDQLEITSKALSVNQVLESIDKTLVKGDAYLPLLGENEQCYEIKSSSNNTSQ